ncbi:MAG TPA: GGDEF domain-containing protein [Candidatus Limnocylindrales bacterium]|nr:GGDEF domain-containing protein [Candidatus Limnocylindrales bacterium]
MERNEPQLTLLDAARIVARGGDLESELQALAGHVLAATGARAAVVYLLDPNAQSLIPAAAAGIDASRVAAADSVPVDTSAELVARVARDRLAAKAAGGEGAQALEGSSQSGGGLVGLPLMAGDDVGREEIEGVLLVSFTGEAPEPGSLDEALVALADLAAVAISKARLSHALTQRSEWIERLASTDVLTGIANRATFERMLELELARAVRQQTEVSLVLFDVDGMTELNQREGQLAGDDVLRHVAALLAEQVRLIDTIGRLGGDEFGVIAPGGGGQVVADRISKAAARLATRGGAAIALRTAVAVYPRDSDAADGLLQLATTHLEKARA